MTQPVVSGSRLPGDHRHRLDASFAETSRTLSQVPIKRKGAFLLFTPRVDRVVSSSLVVFLIGVACACPAHAGPTSADRAQQVAAGWLKSDAAPLGAMLSKTISEVKTYADADGRPLYYVVVLQPTGFVIVAADDWIEPVIAFAGGGTYDPSLSNPLGALVTNDAPGRIALVRKAQSQELAVANQASRTAQSKWARFEQVAGGQMEAGLPSVSDIRVSPLLQSMWDQETACNNACYNYYTPSGYPCGCVATAMAQLMRFHMYPTTGIGVRSFSIYVDGAMKTARTRGGDGAGGPYNWDNMPFVPDCTATAAQRQAIGALCYDAGLSVNMYYTAYGSAADTLDAKTRLVSTFGYSNAIKGFNDLETIGTGLNVMANPNLDAGYPVILGITGEEGGHAIVTDGYGYHASTLYHHLNMGWSGYDNAWYNLPNIDTTYYEFTSVYKCIYNVYVTGSGEIISGRVTDKTGAPLSGATVTGQTAAGATFTDMTDSRGIYALAKVPSATTFTLSVTYEGLAFSGKTVTTGTSTDYNNTSGNLWLVNFGASEAPPTAEDAAVDAVVGDPMTIALRAIDEGLPSPPGAMTYIIKSLPTRGSLNDPAVGSITRVPYTLANGGNQVVYAASSAGPDSFTFIANDGGAAPKGGNSNVAKITITAADCEPLAIGGSGTAWNYPMYTYYHDCRVQSIYLASEVGRPGKISELSLNVTRLPGQDMTAWTIRMKHTALSEYETPEFEDADWTVVYQGTEPRGEEAGLRTFKLTTPFTYDGESNLMIDFSFNNSSYTSSGYCSAWAPGGIRSACATADSQYGDPLTWVGKTKPIVSGSANVPAVLFTVCSVPLPPPAASNFGHSANTVNSIAWTWVDMSGNESGFRGHDEAHVQKWTAGANVVTYTETGLAANTPYTRHVHAHNTIGEAKASDEMTVFTSIEPVGGLQFGTVTSDSIQVRSANTPSNLTAGGSGLELKNETVLTTSGWVHANDYWVSSSLTANTACIFTGQSRNGDGDVTPPVKVVKWTLPVTPDATSDSIGSCPAQTTGSAIVFTSTPAFGIGGVDHYHFLWDTKVDSVPTDKEVAVWSGGTLPLIANSGGRWYLHLLSHNGEHASGGVAHIGPVLVSAAPVPMYSAGDYDRDCDVDYEDLTRFLQCVTGPGVAVTPECVDTLLDSDGDLDQTDFGIFQQCWTGGAPSDPFCGH